jgi:hypothetical protein
MTNIEQKFQAVLKTLKNNNVMVLTKSDGIYIRLAGNINKGEIFTLHQAKVLPFEENNTNNFSKEKIANLAAERYPIGNVSENDRDTLEMFRRIYSEGADKVASMMFTQEDVDIAYDKGFKESEIGKFIDSLRMELFFPIELPKETQIIFEQKFARAVESYKKSIKK